MKIVSKFGDYYDCIQKYGYDESSMYIRKTSQVEVSNLDYIEIVGVLERFFEMSSHMSYRYEDMNIEPKFLIFSGKLYPFLIIKCYLGKKDGYGCWEKSTSYCFSFNELEEVFEKYQKLYPKSDYIKRKMSVESWTSTWRTDFNSHNVKEFYSLGESLDVSKLAIDLECPAILFENKTIKGHSFNNAPSDPQRRSNRPQKLCVYKMTLNPPLSDIKFYSVLDTFSAYHAIQTFIEQQLGGNSPMMAEISNESKIEKAGFDLKTSFRKAPTKKR